MTIRRLTPAVARRLGTVQARSEEVSLSVPGAELHATLTIPDSVGCPPVLLILAGSGPTDRDGNSPLGVHSNVYRKLALALEGAGYAVLRPDKRLIGESTVSDPREDVLTFGTYIQDAEAWLRWLGEQTDLAQVGVIGHSEGALIGLGAALYTPVSAYVSLAGAGESVTNLIIRQLHTNTAMPSPLLQEAERIMVSLQAGQTVAAVSSELMGLFRPSVQPYMISWMRLDPPAMLSRLNVPALIVQGDRDVQVSVQDAQNLAAAQPKAQLSVIVGMNHILVDAPAALPENLATYAQPELPLNTELVQTLTHFLDRVMK
ncbi:alpha/beta hydrolase [Deinococcus detaillensis]|uniref:Alpha/beta hydrolase n=1 Tax=Deinococcus detaillensis TaxID=2592048 RepID=A0A553UIF9_9DEIO|nr:alpha/beta fold hydrolase [Deinococcus detaillensis]TSA79946.1 alpha/beta hydrolase [Deinococcus detaillensis]